MRVVKVLKFEFIEVVFVKRFKWYKFFKGLDVLNIFVNILKLLVFDVGKMRGGMMFGVVGLVMGGIGGGVRLSIEFGMRDYVF